MTNEEPRQEMVAPEVATSRLWHALYEAKTTGAPATAHVGRLVVALEAAAPSDVLWADQLAQITEYAALHEIPLPSIAAKPIE